MRHKKRKRERERAVDEKEKFIAIRTVIFVVVSMDVNEAIYPIVCCLWVADWLGVASASNTPGTDELLVICLTDLFA